MFFLYFRFIERTNADWSVDFPFDLIAAVAKFLRWLVDNALEVDFESAWFVWDLIEISIFIAAAVFLFGLVRHSSHLRAKNKGRTIASDATVKIGSPLNTAFETVEKLIQNATGSAARTLPTNQEIRDAASVLLSTTRDAESRFPLVAELVQSDRLMLGQPLVDQFVSLAGESSILRKSQDRHAGNGP